MTDPRSNGARPQPPAPSRPSVHPPHPTLRPSAVAALEARQRRGPAQPTGIRMVVGLASLASASALVSVMLPSILPQPTVVTTMDTTAAATDPTQQPEPSVIHVTHVITLAPGQTLPPDAGINYTPAPATPAPRATPRPTPRVIVQTITRQSGKP